jgi:hypothetical protein
MNLEHTILPSVQSFLRACTANKRCDASGAMLTSMAASFVHEVQGAAKELGKFTPSEEVGHMAQMNGAGWAASRSFPSICPKQHTPTSQHGRAGE